MPEYLAPGVYVEEVDTGNKPIEGVSTSTVGFVGVAQRGPTAPTFIGSFAEFGRTYGSYVTGAYLPNAVEGFFLNGGKRCFVVRVVGQGAAAATPAAPAALGDVQLRAIGPGDWANGRLAVKIDTPGLSNPNAPPGTPALFKLGVFYWGPTVNLPAGGPLDPTVPANQTDPNFRAPTLAESYDNLSTDPNSGNYYVSVINGASDLLHAASGGPNPPTIPNFQTFAGGTNGNALAALDFTGDPTLDPGQKTGIAALEEIDEISILCCPDEYTIGTAAAATIRSSLITQCELLKYRFAITHSAQSGVPAIQNHYPTSVSKYAAYYYPWLVVPDPITQDPLQIPPSGHMAGIYARTDIERGVHKAPANEIINGLFFDPQNPSAGLQVQVTKAQQEILNPRGVNALRYFPGRGNLVWGARTTTSDPDWKYINVRRLFIFIEKSIDQGTQWVVFEPNDAPLWAKVRRSVSDFLTRVWMDGMLQGATKEQAYFVRCDRTTMTQADIDNGRLIILVGIAPVKPAEFVIFRIGQWTAGSDVAEG
jgi:phage tail sheath protein FI